MKMGLEKINQFSNIFEQNEFVKLNREDNEVMDTIEEQLNADL